MDMHQPAIPTSQPFRVVKRTDIGGARVWDVYGDHLGDYLATMNPILPVSRATEGRRICDVANARYASSIAQPQGGTPNGRE
jgi:hypothetical protein